MINSIQVIYAPGTWGNAFRWLLDRFSQNSKFQSINSPWDEFGRAHGFEEADYNKLYKRGHQVDGRNGGPDPDSDKIVIGYHPDDLLFIVRCGYYRTPGMETEATRIKNIIDRQDSVFVTESFGQVHNHASVAKELIKIQFHDMQSHEWWSAMDKIMKEDKNYFMPLQSMFDVDDLKNELLTISKRYHLDLKIEDNVVANVVEKIANNHVVKTRNRFKDVLNAVKNRKSIKCADLDFFEQAYVETTLEKQNDSIVFPYGTNWFTNTKQINVFLDTYPKYLKHMNPRLPWYNGMPNPYHVRQIDKKNKSNII